MPLGTSISAYSIILLNTATIEYFCAEFMFLIKNDQVFYLNLINAHILDFYLAYFWTGIQCAKEFEFS